MTTHEKDGQIPLRDFIEQHLDPDELCRWLARRFPTLKAHVEDVLSDVIVELLKSPKYNSEGKTHSQWRAFIKNRLKWRALDLLRAIESIIFIQISGEDEDSTRGESVPGSECGPKTKVQEGERRGKQILLLSDVFREFVDWCEKRPSGYTMKEVYERRCRGQEVADIAARMGLVRNTVDQTIKRAREWVVERVKASDVSRSVFVTILRGVSPNIGPVTVRILKFKQPAVVAINSFYDVLRFVMDEMGAFCPSARRLAAYYNNPDDRQYSDVRYHVQEVGCRHCRDYHPAIDDESEPEYGAAAQIGPQPVARR